jgi:hypothetical protein
MGPSAYERRAHEQIQAWKKRQPTWIGRGRRILNLPLETAGNLIFKVPGVAWAVDQSVGPVVGALNAVAQSSVRHAAIHRAYRDGGHAQVRQHADLLSLDLEQIDRAIGRLGAKYQALALAEGAATGLAGLGGIPVDVVALVLLNLRAIGEYAAYCGFDLRGQEERLFAMNVLGYASSAAPGRDKYGTMAQLAKIARDVSTRRPWKELKKHAFVRVVRRIARAVGVRVTRAKLAQIIPAAGAVFGGVFNAQFTSGVCDTAHMFYRERFLLAKYGPAFLDPAPPAAGQLSPA